MAVNVSTKISNESFSLEWSVHEGCFVMTYYGYDGNDVTILIQPDEEFEQLKEFCKVVSEIEP